MVRVLFILMSLAMLGCHNRMPLAGRWEAKEQGAVIRHIGIAKDGRLQLVYAQAPDTLVCQYALHQDTLRFFNAFGEQALVLKPVNGRLLEASLLHGNGEAQSTFDRRSKNCSPLQSDVAFSGRERTLRDLLPWLGAPTVELRMKSLLMAFKEGDYLTKENIAILLGLPIEPSPNKPPDEMAVRFIASRMERITRVGNNFVATLAGNEEIEQQVPVYEYTPQGRRQQAALDLKIAPGAKATIKTSPRDIRIDIDGVKIGVGWLKAPMPPLSISGNKGSLMGLQFNLSR